MSQFAAIFLFLLSADPALISPTNSVQDSLEKIAQHRAARYANWAAFRGPLVVAGAKQVARFAEHDFLFLLDRQALPAFDRGGAPKGTRQLSGPGPWPTGRLLVRMPSDSTGESTGKKLAASLGLTWVRSLDVKGWILLDAFDASAAAGARRQLKNRGMVVELERLVRLDLRTPFDDVHYPAQWHLENTNQRPELPSMSAGADISAPGAWAITLGLPDAIIAVIDTGMVPEHPDFNEPGKVVAPLDTTDGSTDPRPDPFEYQGAHGMACSGLAAASRQGTTGVVGVCPDCSLMPIRILGEQGFTTDTAVADAFVHARNNGAWVASNSWGYVFERVPQVVDDALTSLVEEGRGGLGTVVLFAMGNSYEETTAYEIATHPRVIAVGGTGADDVRVNYSTFGNGLDIMAPTGHEVEFDIDGAPILLGPLLLTTDLLGSEGYNPDFDNAFDPDAIDDDDYTVSMSGTSGSTPIAAGLAGLILSADPLLTYEQVMWLLRETADKRADVEFDERGWNAFYGHGRINAAAALTALADPICQPFPENCQDNLDNDCDGAIDGLDDDCGFTLPLPTVTIGRPCTEFFDPVCDDGFCFLVGGDTGWCSLLCTTGSCADGLCLVWDDGFSEGYGACTQPCDSDSDSDCGSPLLCSSTQSGVCLAACTENWECPLEFSCSDGRCVGDVDDPGVVPEPDPAPEPDGPGPDVTEPDPDPAQGLANPDEGAFPSRRPPGRVVVSAAEFGCTQGGEGTNFTLPFLALLIGLARRARRSGSRTAPARAQRSSALALKITKGDCSRGRKRR